MTDAWTWLTTGAHWAGPEGIGQRLAEHVYVSGLALLIACAVALPVGLGLGHLGRGGALAVNVSNVGRAVPVFAVLALFMVSPLRNAGYVPTVVALVLFAIPPLLTNAYVGVREVDRAAVRAARGMGMTGGQVFLRVELPLARPVVMTGVRSAAVQVVATATVAAMVGQGGLGRVITAGFALYDTAQVVAGAVLVAALALVVEGVLAGADRLLGAGRPRTGAARGHGGRTQPDRRRDRRPDRRSGMGDSVNGFSRSTRAVVGTAALAVALTACGGESLEQGKGGTAGGSGGSGGGGKGSLVVGAAAFTESKVLAELYAQVLRDAGYTVSVTTVKNRELYEPSLENGQIDVVPEYAATLAEFLNAKVNGPKAPEEKPVASGDAKATVEALRKLAEPRGLKVLEAGGAVDQNAFAVSKEFAAKNRLSTLSDLGRAKLKVRIAAGDECAVRPFCAPGLKARYGIDVAGVDPKGVGTPQAKQAVRDGVDQLVLTTTTDATLDSFGLVLLADDKKLQNADNVLPVVNAKDAGAPEIATALNKITKVLGTADLAELNRKVDAERAKPEDAAKAYLQSKGLLSK